MDLQFVSLYKRHLIGCLASEIVLRLAHLQVLLLVHHAGITFLWHTYCLFLGGMGLKYHTFLNKQAKAIQKKAEGKRNGKPCAASPQTPLSLLSNLSYTPFFLTLTLFLTLFLTLSLTLFLTLSLALTHTLTLNRTHTHTLTLTHSHSHKMTSYVKHQIAKKLAMYFKDMSADKLALSVFKGTAVLNDVELEQAFLRTALLMPPWLFIKQASCNRAHCKLSISRLKSHPMVIDIDEIKVVVEAVDPEDQARHYHPDQQQNQGQKQDGSDAEHEDGSQGKAEKYGVGDTVVDGITLNVKLISVEVNTPDFFAHVQLKGLHAESVDRNWLPVKDLRHAQDISASKDFVTLYKKLTLDTIQIALTSSSVKLPQVTANTYARLALCARVSLEFVSHNSSESTNVCSGFGHFPFHACHCSTRTSFAWFSRCSVALLAVLSEHRG